MRSPLYFYDTLISLSCFVILEFICDFLMFFNFFRNVGLFLHKPCLLGAPLYKKKIKNRACLVESMTKNYKFPVHMALAPVSLLP